MAYIGREPQIGNFQVCDAISVVNGQAAYTMQVGSVNVSPESANHMIVSLNGTIQKPNSSFTVSGSTITFASNLVTNDVIDFIQILGDVLDLGVPSDATVTDAKTNFVSTSSAAGLQIKGDGTTDGTLQLNCSQNSHGIKIKSPPHSASASYTLTMPNNDGDADQFLQTNGSGVLSFAAAGGGKVNQVIVSTSEASEAGTDSYNSYADFSSNPTISITPSATSSKILIEFSAIFSVGNSSAGADVAICDSSNNVIVEQGMYGNRRNNLVLWKLHSANTTSQVTYKIRGKVNSSGGHFIYMDSGSSNPKRTVFWRATEILA